MPTATKARPDWRTVVQDDAFSNVMRLVHLSVRYDKIQQDAIRAELTTARQRAYNDELSIQARRAGCTRSGELSGGASLKALNQMSKEDAVSIANTYNSDLAQAIIGIREETPTANRNVYATQLREWETNRAEGKAPQIAQWAEVTARSKAQQDFYKNNTIDGVAELQPEVAVCPVCAGFIARGSVPMKVAQHSPPPFHLRCPHYWQTYPEKVNRQDCNEIWMG